MDFSWKHLLPTASEDSTTPAPSSPEFMQPAGNQSWQDWLQDTTGVDMGEWIQPPSWLAGDDATPQAIPPGPDMPAMETPSGPRRVDGAGGYRYEQHPDGRIVILDGPGINRPVNISAGQAGWQAITDEIGPYPQAAAKTPEPAAPDTAAPDTAAPDTAAPTAPAPEPDESMVPTWLSAWWTEETKVVSEALPEDFLRQPEAPAEMAYISQRSNGKDGRWEDGKRTNSESIKYDQAGNAIKTPKTWYGDITCGHTSLAMVLREQIPEERLYPAVATLLIRRGKSNLAHDALVADLKSHPNRLSEVLVDLYTMYYGSSTELMDITEAILEVSGDDRGTMRHEAPAGEDRFSFIQETAQEKSILSTQLTGSGGHFIVLDRILSDGIVVNDPFGMSMAENNPTTKKYALNGGNPGIVRRSESEDILARRTRESGRFDELMAAREEKRLPQDMGRQVFFGAEELGPLKIGTYITHLTAGETK
ncbi:MAG: hypothetical protein AAFV53_37150 [Myxococcota bacterium]